VFTKYLDILNGTGKGKAPSGVGKVDKLTVYDRAGKVVKRFVKGPNDVWTIEP